MLGFYKQRIMEIQGCPERVRMEKVFCHDNGLLNDCKNLKCKETNSVNSVQSSIEVSTFVVNPVYIAHGTEE